MARFRAGSGMQVGVCGSVGSQAASHSKVKGVGTGVSSYDEMVLISYLWAPSPSCICISSLPTSFPLPLLLLWAHEWVGYSPNGASCLVVVKWTMQSMHRLV